jgi:hypothetical protein
MDAFRPNWHDMLRTSKVRVWRLHRGKVWREMDYKRGGRRTTSVAGDVVQAWRESDTMDLRASKI